MKYTVYYKVEGHRTWFKFPGEYIEADSKEEVYKKKPIFEDIVEAMWGHLKMADMIVKKKRCQKEE